MTQPSAETVRSQFIQRLKYAPDRFQVEAMNSLDAGASVLVAAPTGSGKTLVAEYAIDQAMASEQRSFYTAPIKALSNQKFRDLCDLYGSDKVGLVTGDNAINSEAPIVVMTTEVLRNMIYSSSPRLEQLGVVVLDEVHFLQDTYRGPVWEEVIIQLPLEVQLVCLSATVSNADEVGTWLTTVRGRTDVIVESKRPVELVNHFALGDSSTGRVSMYDTIVNGEANGSVRRLLDSERAIGRSGKVRGRGHRQRFYTPSRPDLVDLLSSQDLLPAIVFIFSRAQCEDAVNACIRDGIVLTDPEEEARIIQIINDKTSDLTPDDRIALRYDDFLEQAGAGISCHHAGMIPMFKEAIEQCFIEGLVKVVFATETLAVGINMPARAVVIEKLTKFTGENHMLLKASEFAQLTGRAGRRGLDDIGHALTLWNPFITFDQIVALALSRSFRLSSAFRPTFNMAVNLVRAHTRQGTHHVLNLSFAQFQTDKDVVLSEANLQSKKLAALELSRTANGVIEDLDDALPISISATELEIALRGLRPGDVVLFESSILRGRGAIIATATRKSGTRLTVVTASKKVVQLSASDLQSLPRRSGGIDLPIPYEPTQTEFLRETAKRLTKAKIFEEVVVEPIVTEPASETAPRSTRERRQQRLLNEIAQMEQRMATRAGSVSARFDDVVVVLEELGYIQGWKLTEKGVLLSRVFHESDLLIVEVISSGMLDSLSPVDLASVLSTVVFETRGPDSGGPVRWPNETVTNRFKRIERLTMRLHEIQRAHSMSLYRKPDGGLAFEISQWVAGKNLSTVLHPDLTPGDFVRSVRQLIDLLNQIASAAPDEKLRESAAQAVNMMNRGVVAAGMTSESVQLDL